MHRILRSGIFFGLLFGTAVSLIEPARGADVTVELDAGSGFVVKDNTGTIERLRVDEATGNVSRNGALFVHTTGTDNTFVGEGAGSTNPTGLRNSAFGKNALSSSVGFDNSAFGEDALRNNANGTYNSAFGQAALFSNINGANNSAFGEEALYSSTSGGANAAFGSDSLGANTTGSANSAFGQSALRFNTTGIGNVAVGVAAGLQQTTGNDNIYISNQGVSGESGQIKIGTVGTHTDAFIAGIDGNVVAGSAVLVTASGELGVAASSSRFKHDIQDMASASSVLMDLRPVTFRYRDEVGGAGEERQYGLIAEEVARVAPELVRLDEEGAPFSVHYEQLAPMLLNELQKQQRIIREQRAQLGREAERNEAQEARIATLLSRLDTLETQIAGGRAGTDR